MDSNPWDDEDNTENIKRHEPLSRHRIAIISVCFITLAIIVVTLALLLKFVIIPSTEPENTAATPITSSTITSPSFSTTQTTTEESSATTETDSFTTMVTSQPPGKLRSNAFIRSTLSLNPVHSWRKDPELKGFCCES